MLFVKIYVYTDPKIRLFVLTSKVSSIDVALCSSGGFNIRLLRLKPPLPQKDALAPPSSEAALRPRDGVTNFQDSSLSRPNT